MNFLLAKFDKDSGNGVRLGLYGSDRVPAISGPETSGLDRRNFRGRICCGCDGFRLQHDGALGLVYNAQLVKPQLNGVW